MLRLQQLAVICSKILCVYLVVIKFCNWPNDFYCKRIRTPKDCCNLRKRTALAVNCWVKILCLEVSCKGDQITSAKLTTDRQTVNYYSTIHSLELIYFDSKTQETMKKQLYPSDFYNFPSLQWRNPVKGLSVTQASTCTSYVFHVRKKNDKTTLHHLKRRYTVARTTLYRLTSRMMVRMTSQNGDN